MNDSEALDQIQRILDGTEWEVSDLDEIATVVADTGRGIADPGEHTREELLELLADDYLDSFSQDMCFPRQILMHGHKGFENMTYSELLWECKDNGLVE